MTQSGESSLVNEVSKGFMTPKRLLPACFSVLVSLHTHTHAHEHLQRMQMFLCVQLMAAGSRGHVVGQRWRQMSRHLGKAYCSLNSYFKLVFAEGNRPLPPTPFTKLLTGCQLSCSSSYLLLFCCPPHSRWAVTFLTSQIWIHMHWYFRLIKWPSLAACFQFNKSNIIML